MNKARLTSFHGRGPALIAALATGVVLVSLLSAVSGQVRIPVEEVIGSLLHRLGLEIGPLPSAAQGESTLWVVRFPRVILAMVVGAALGCSGAIMQGIFGNPLAEPGIVGVSAGAAVGAFLVIVFGIAFVGVWSVALAAFVFGLLTTLVVYTLARSGGRTEVVTLVLTGIALNAVMGAGIGLLTFVSDTEALRTIAFWNLGSMARSTWEAIAVVLPCALIGIAFAFRNARQLDLLSLGERSARHLGVRVERLRLKMIVVVALLTASAVAFTGIIGFVGLVVPHFVRILVGPGHRLLIPASVLGGALVVAGADLIARTIVPYQELPLGVLTALVGGPAFFVLLRRTRAQAGGWG